MNRAGRGTTRGRAALRVDAIGDRIHLAQTEHVNWVMHVGPDGVTLVDSGYAGQRRLLEASLRAVGCRPEDVTAVLVTHGHADHLGGAAWLAETYGTPVYAHVDELANVRRERLEQAGPADVVRNLWRPGVARWVSGMLPLLRGGARLGVPSASPLPVRGGRVDGRVGGRVDGGIVEVPGRPRVRLVAGHTSGHAVFEFEDSGVIVVGDALITRHRISPIVGPQLLPEMFHHDAELARASLAVLRDSTARVMLTGHGEPWIGSAAAAVEVALANGVAW
ncbi:MBL fold metallo-hydrolase [Agromyces sp. CFH 90414]|uniref:beta-lactamase n=1 Tax=Agromyces agglutinans TaxID=2662258 RepID=A0A6I2FCL3_9MICO|nr:MBL fold metallo-hydrolase [Agromyces agglutinans]MRG60216.1 MBL fold metallo-hydrolase [Agromyces agglutinans]